MVHEPLLKPLAQPAPSHQNGISTSFRHVFASPRPENWAEIPLFPGKFCLNVPHRTVDDYRHCRRRRSSTSCVEPGLGTSSPLLGS